MNNVGAKSVGSLAKAANEWVRSMLGMISSHLEERLTLFAGGALFFIGFAEVLGEFDHSQSLDIAGPILRVSFRQLMLINGTMQLAASLVLLFTNMRIFGFGLAAWTAANFLAFRIGLWNAGWHHGSGFMFSSLGLSPVMTDAVTSLLSLVLLLGIGIAIWMERRALQAAESLKIPCPTCGGHIKFSRKNLGQKIPCPHCQKVVALEMPGLLKITCVLCGGHVEFPSHAVGQKIPCPHCAKNITLLKPA